MGNTGALSIGTLGTEDIEDAVALWGDAGLIRPWNDPRADIRCALGRADATVLAGRIAGRLGATAMVGCDGHRGWVYYLAVAADYRGRGFGRAMMDAAEAFTAARGIAKIQVMVRGDNTAVVGFYRALGYETGDVVVLGRRLDARLAA